MTGNACVARASKRVCAVHWEHKAMGQLLMILIVPPLVGVVTYAIFRFIWEKDEQADRSPRLDAR